MCNAEETNVVNQNYLDALLLKAQIEGIQKEVHSLKTYFARTIADYRFECIRNKHEWDADEAVSQEEKLDIYKKMYLEIIDYIISESEEANLELLRKHYPECANLPEEIEWQQIEDIDEEMKASGYPFD